MATEGRLVSLEDELRWALQERLHTLAVHRNDTWVIADGDFALVDGDGVYDTYKIKMGIPDQYPWSEPKVWETGRRIPEIADRHNSNGACVCVWEQWLADTSDRSIAAYLDGPLNRFFLSQTLFELTGKWPFGQEPHSQEGIVTAYARTLGIPADRSVIRRYLRILARDDLKGRWPCPCGSGERIGRCHREQMAELDARIDPKLARQMLGRLTSNSEK